MEEKGGQRCRKNKKFKRNCKKRLTFFINTAIIVNVPRKTGLAKTSYPAGIGGGRNRRIERVSCGAKAAGNARYSG